MQDVADRLADRVQLTSDGHRAYLEAVEGAFRADVDYAQLIKMYGNAPDAFKGPTAPPNAPGSKRSGSRAIPTRGTSARPMSKDKTSRCGCTCAASLG